MAENYVFHLGIHLVMNPPIMCFLGYDEPKLHQFIQSGFDVADGISESLLGLPPRHNSLHSVVCVCLLMIAEVLQNIISQQTTVAISNLIHEISDPVWRLRQSHGGNI